MLFVYYLSALEPFGTPEGQLERRRHWNCPQGYWNARKALLRPLYCLLAGDIISVLLSPGTCEAPLELREAHNLSAERSVRADNRSCSAIRDFLCVRVLVG